jgi:hypothetical protein
MKRPRHVPPPEPLRPTQAPGEPVAKPVRTPMRPTPPALREGIIQALVELLRAELADPTTPPEA